MNVQELLEQIRQLDITAFVELIAKLEGHYKVKFNFDDNFLHFPLYKDKGHYSDLSFYHCYIYIVNIYFHIRHKILKE